MRRQTNRRGFSIILVVLLLVAFVGITAVAIDFPRMYLIRTQLHTAADAAAHAGAQRLMFGDWKNASVTAIAYADSDSVEHKRITMAAGDVVPGTWNGLTFTAGTWSDTTNAVQTTARYTAAYVFGRFYGRTTSARTATSIAAVGSARGPGAPGGARGGASCVRPLAMRYDSVLKLLYPVSTPPASHNLTAAEIATLIQASPRYYSVGSGSSDLVSPVGEPPQVYKDGTTPSSSPSQSGSVLRQNLGDSCSALAASLAPDTVIGRGDTLQKVNGNKTGPIRQGIGDLCGASGQTFACNVTARMVIWDPSVGDVKYVIGFVITGFDSGSGILGYFATVSGSGRIDFAPGSASFVKRFVLVR